MSHILLDTSPIIGHLRSKIDLVKVLPSEALIFTSLFTVGELEKGINRADHPDKERARVDQFLEHVAVLMPDEATAAIYGSVSGKLCSRGQRIPENDVWIAAVALQCEMTLATADAHFDRVSGLDVLQIEW